MLKQHLAQQVTGKDTRILVQVSNVSEGPVLAHSGPLIG